MWERSWSGCGQPPSPTASSLFDCAARASARIWPQRERLDSVDSAYHVRHSALPWPGTERDFGRFVSHLHSVPLDKSHPLWTFDIIEGLDGDRFAVLGKMHHALADGVGALRLFQHWLSADPGETEIAPMWVKGAPPRERPSEVRRAIMDTTLFRRTLAGAARGFTQPVKAIRDNMPALRFACTGVAAGPWAAPETVLNTPITGHRRSRHRATASSDSGHWPTHSAARSTMLFWRSAPLPHRDRGASRDGLDRQYSCLRSQTRYRPGCGKCHQLGDGAASDRPERPARARPNHRLGDRTGTKRRLEGISGAAINTYTLAVTTPILFEQLLGLGGRTRPYYNLPISNVPGPRKQLYLDSAPLVDSHASTVIYHGQALNIVCLSYTDKLEFTFTACSTALPQVQRVAVHCGAELDALEAVSGMSDVAVTTAG